MELYELDDLMNDLGLEPTTEQLNSLLRAFENDFVHTRFYIDGLTVKVVLKGSKVDGYQTYPETFVHLITRKGSNGERLFDRHRANKIHWIKCILQNRRQEEVTFFQFPEANGTLRDYYWYKEGNFIVIMEKIRPDYIVVTSFHIDGRRNKEYFEKRERWYVNSPK